MNFWTAVVIVMSMVFGTGFVAILLDHLQKRRKQVATDDKKRIETLEKRVQIQEQQILELTENQRYVQRLLEDTHDEDSPDKQSTPPGGQIE